MKRPKPESMASKGGKARAAKLTPERRSEISRAGGYAKAAARAALDVPREAPIVTETIRTDEEVYTGDPNSVRRTIATYESRLALLKRQLLWLERGTKS
jgi:general stress protein YciG